MEHKRLKGVTTFYKRDGTGKAQNKELEILKEVDQTKVN
jgi:hypothetical protein